MKSDSFTIPVLEWEGETSAREVPVRVIKWPGRRVTEGEMSCSLREFRMARRRCARSDTICHSPYFVTKRSRRQGKV